MKDFNRAQVISELIRNDIQKIRRDLENDYEDGLIAVLEFGLIGYREFSDDLLIEEVTEREAFAKYGY
jgi:hypothetical protein